MESLINHEDIIEGKGWDEDSWTTQITRSKSMLEPSEKPATVIIPTSQLGLWLCAFTKFISRMTHREWGETKQQPGRGRVLPTNQFLLRFSIFSVVHSMIFERVSPMGNEGTGHQLSYRLNSLHLLWDISLTLIMEEISSLLFQMK